MSTILLVHPDPEVRRRAEGAIAPLGHAVVTAVDGLEALGIIESTSPALVITGLSLPRADGVTLVKALRARALAVPVIIVSRRRDAASAMEALAVGARYFVPLPLIDEDLRDKVEGLLGRRVAGR